MESAMIAFLIVYFGIPVIGLLLGEMNYAVGLNQAWLPAVLAGMVAAGVQETVAFFFRR